MFSGEEDQLRNALDAALEALRLEEQDDLQDLEEEFEY